MLGCWHKLFSMQRFLDQRLATIFSKFLKKKNLKSFCRGIKCNEIEQVNPVLKANLLISLKFGLHESSATKYKRGKTATLEKYIRAIREWIGLLERKEMQWLTVIVFDEAGFEAFQFVAGDDCLRLNINIALKSARNWNWKARLLLFLKGSLNFSHPLSDAWILWSFYSVHFVG